MQRKVQVKPMNHKNSLLLAAVVMILAIAVISALSVKSAKENGSVHIVFGGRAELRNTIELSASEIDTLNVKYSGKNIVVYPSENDSITIKEYLISDSSEAQAEVDIINNADTGKKTVNVTGGKAFALNIFGFFAAGERIEVYLPEEGPEGLLIQAGSGNIKAESDFSIRTNLLELTVGSGNIGWHDTDAEEIHIQAGSGNISAKNLIGDMEIGTGSGDIKLTYAEGSAEITAGSGNISIDDFSGQGSVTAGSGNIKMEVLEIKGDLKLKTGSGNSRLVLPQQSAFSLEVQTGSGNIKTSFDDMLSYNKKGNRAKGDIGGKPAVMVSVKANSGNVSITAEN